MIQREPLRLTAGIWAAWLILTLVAVVAPSMALWIAWLAIFLVVELPASLIETGKRDTLSETITWVQRHLSKHRRFARGWNAFILLITYLVVLAATIPFWLGYERLVHIASGPVVAALCGVWLYDHWMSPDEHG